uniref:Uncharacterized protein n=1 Tax=Phenylobacterium glaciei TaxID=2803784 RepID=A0A974P5N3_9CAUL|nr:hypothetical protein JKL49_10740 [Phenylobacterium glaciei]
MPQLTTEVAQIAERARPGVLGVGVMNLESGESWDFNGERRFPCRACSRRRWGPRSWPRWTPAA